MIHRLSIPIDRVFKECIALNSQDFRGLRTQRPDMDIVFEDFVMTEDDLSAITSEILNISAVIYTKIKGYVCQWYVDSEVCFYIHNDMDAYSTEQILLNTLVYSVLAWWYETRLPDLSVVYREKANLALSSLMEMITPKFATRKLRMF